jgi:hypothetical protein
MASTGTIAGAFEEDGADREAALRAVDNTDWAAYGARLLALAAQVLAPENRGPFDPRIARLLLREATVVAIRAMTGAATIRSIADAAAALDRRPDLHERTRWSERRRAALSVLDDDLDSVREVENAEPVVTDLVRAALATTPRRRFWVVYRKWILLSAAILSVACALVVAIVQFASTTAGPRYRWKSSSSGFGYPTSGTLDDRGDRGVLFHTDQQKDPWVLIDMLAPRMINRVVIENRLDCCRERAIPLVVEALNADLKAVEVGRATAPFGKWILEFPPRQARYVRLRTEGNTMLHLREVEIP